MVSRITNEIKQFLVERFGNESAFDDLCREIGIVYHSTENFDDRITGVIKKAESNLPDYIYQFYAACITLRPEFENKIQKIFNIHLVRAKIQAFNSKPITIFLSYSWKSKNVADEMDTAFNISGIHLVRDITYAQYKTDLIEFMSSIRTCNYAVTILSDAYLKSPNCMFEIIELLKEQRFKDKILPVFLPDAKIFRPADRIEYITYWNIQYDELKAKAKNLDLAQVVDIAADLKTLEEIRMNIGDFMHTIGAMRLIPYDELKASGFKELFDAITGRNV